jgi:hypothetical protein
LYSESIAAAKSRGKSQGHFLEEAADARRPLMWPHALRNKMHGTFDVSVWTPQESDS